MSDSGNKPRFYDPRSLFAAFFTGLALLAPLLLTGIVLGWVFTQLVAFFGPDSFFGQALTAGGRLFLHERVNPLLSFAVGMAMVIGLVTALGYLVRDKFREVLQDAVDRTMGGIPFLGNIYRPVAQLVRSVSGDNKEMSAMAVCRVEFGGGVETIAFLASAETMDLGNGPQKLVLIPTAPVPVGGALLLVAAEKVHILPNMKFDDIAKLYLTMGMTPPPALRRAEQLVSK